MSDPAATPVPDVTLRGLERTADIITREPATTWDLYPSGRGLAVRGVERLAAGRGLRLEVRGAATLAATITAEAEAQVRCQVRGHHVEVSFGRHGETTPQSATLHLQGLDAAGALVGEHHVQLLHVDAARDAAAGRTMASRIIVQDADLRFGGSQVADWTGPTPSAEDRALARQRWAPALAESSDYARARAVMTALLAIFETRRGVPSNAMNGLPPFRQLARVEAGEDRVWCANICEIIAHALNCLDLPCRLVRMRHTHHNATPGVAGEDYEVLLVGGHTVLELHDARRDQWLWADPTLHLLGATDAANHGLNLVELQWDLHHPRRAPGLRLERWDPGTGEVRTESVGACPVAAELRRYLRPEQRFFYCRHRPALA